MTGNETTSVVQPGQLARPPALLPRGSRRSTVVRSASVMVGNGQFSNKGSHWAKMLDDPF